MGITYLKGETAGVWGYRPSKRLEGGGEIIVEGLGPGWMYGAPVRGSMSALIGEAITGIPFKVNEPWTFGGAWTGALVR